MHIFCQDFPLLIYYRLAPTSIPEKRLPLSHAEQKHRQHANLSEERENQIKEDDRERKME